MRCSKCKRNAIIFQRYSGLHLCERHFIDNVEARAKRTIREHRWVRSGDRIAVAISGGKDSSALLSFLTKTFGMRRDVSIFAITVDEGIAGYRDPTVAEGIAERHGVECRTVSFKKAYGMTIDDIVARKGDRLSCSYCGVLRRRLLNAAARDLGATRLALGFTLDDDAQSVLMNVLRGDTDRLLRTSEPVPGLIPRIRPFSEVPEREVALYAHLAVGGFEERGCPYSYNALRGDARRLLNEYSSRHPSTKYALIRLGDELARRCEGELPPVTQCRECGEPSLGPCRSCQILKELSNDA
jgi:uncharacterized protein (TIGR00269 family)